MAPKKQSVSAKPKGSIRKTFQKKHLTSLKTESHVFGAHTNLRVSKKVAAFVQSFLNHVVTEMLLAQSSAAGAKRITTDIAIACNNGLPFDVPKTTVVTSFIVPDVPVLVHPMARELMHN